jgi:hypothetical protein
MHTIKTANEKERSSAPVNRPHTPNEILQTNKCYRHYDYSGCWNLRKFCVIFPDSNITNTQLLSVLMIDDISAEIKEQSSMIHNIQQKHPYTKSMTHQTWPNTSNTGAVMRCKLNRLMLYNIQDDQTDKESIFKNYLFKWHISRRK